MAEPPQGRSAGQPSGYLLAAHVVIGVSLLTLLGFHSPRSSWLWVECWVVAMALPWLGDVAVRYRGGALGLPAGVIRLIHVGSILLHLAAVVLVAAALLGIADRHAMLWLLLFAASSLYAGVLLFSLLNMPRPIGERVADWLLIASWAVVAWSAAPTFADAAVSLHAGHLHAVEPALNEPDLRRATSAVAMLVLLSELVRCALPSQPSRLNKVFAAAGGLAFVAYFASPHLGLAIDIHWHDTYLVVAAGQVLAVPLITLMVLRLAAPSVPTTWDIALVGLNLVVLVTYIAATAHTDVANRGLPLRVVDLLPYGSSNVQTDVFGWCWLGCLLLTAMIWTRRRRA